MWNVTASAISLYKNGNLGPLAELFHLMSSMSSSSSSGSAAAAGVDFLFVTTSKSFSSASSSRSHSSSTVEKGKSVGDDKKVS